MIKYSFFFQNLKNQIMTTNLWVEQVRKYCINHRLQNELKFVEFDSTFRIY